jgi:hypothetical protein
MKVKIDDIWYDVVSVRVKDVGREVTFHADSVEDMTFGIKEVSLLELTYREAELAGKLKSANRDKDNLLSEFERFKELTKQANNATSTNNDATLPNNDASAISELQNRQADHEGVIRGILAALDIQQDVAGKWLSCTVEKLASHIEQIDQLSERVEALAEFYTKHGEQAVIECAKDWLNHALALNDSKPIDWEQRRYEVAKELFRNKSLTAETAVEDATSLINELKTKKL